MAIWEILDHDILVEIARRIRRSKDYVAFRGVCTTWRFAGTKENFWFRDPLLMLAPRKDSHVRDFFDLSTGSIHEVPLPQARGKRCYSSQGCLLTIGQNLDVELVHPFSNLRVKFPNIKTIQDWDEFIPSSMYESFINKCTLSSSPLLESDYVVMIILGGRRNLLYARPGDETWTLLSTYPYVDITYYKGQFYALTHFGSIMVCNIGGDNPNTVKLVATLSFEITPTQLYIVESEGTLLIISRYLEEVQKDELEVNKSENNDSEVDDSGNNDSEVDGSENDDSEVDSLEVNSSENDDSKVDSSKVDSSENDDSEVDNSENDDSDDEIFKRIDYFKTSRFQVFKLNLNTRTFTEIKDLGGRIIFLGHNSTLSLAAHLTNSKPNSIYFTDDFMNFYFFKDEGGGKDMGIYNLQDGSITPYFSDKSLDRVSPPIWVEKFFN